MNIEETVSSIKQTVISNLESIFEADLDAVSTHQLIELEESCQADVQSEDGFMAVATIGVIDDELIRRGARTRSVQ